MKRHRAKLIKLDQIAKAVAKANGQRLSDLVNTAGITYRQYRRIVIGESDTSLGDHSAVGRCSWSSSMSHHG